MEFNFLRSDRSGTDIYQTIVRMLVYAMVVIVPLLYSPWTSSVLEYNKQLVLIVGAALGLMVWLLGIVVTGKLSVRTTPVDKGVLALLVATIIATICSMTPARSLFGMPGSLSSSLLSVLALTVFYFLAVNTLSDRGRTLRNLLTISLALALIIGVCQMFTWYFLPGDGTHSRAFNTVGSSSALGVLAAAALPLFAKAAARGGIGRIIMSLGGTALSLLVLAILNWWVLWVIALAGMLVIIAFDSLNVTQLANDYSRRRNRFALSRFIVPMVVIVFGAVLLLVDFDIASIKQELPAEVGPSYALSWKVVAGVMSTNLLFGFGPENFSFAFDRYAADQLIDTQLSSVRFFDATSEILTVAAQGGAIALLAGALLCWCLIQVSARFTKAISDSVTRGESAIWAAESSGTLAALAAMTVALLVYPFNLTLFMVWYALLAMAGLIVVGDRRHVIDIEERPLWSLVASLGFIVGLILVLTGLYFASVRYLADVRYAHAADQQALSDAMTGIARAIDLNDSDDRYLRDGSQLALALLREEIREGNTVPDPDRGQRIQNLVASSIQLAQRAVQAVPEESMNWNNLGLVYQAMTGLVDTVEQLAEDAFTKAGELRPGDPTFDNQAGQMWLARADLIYPLLNRSATKQLREQYDVALARAEEAFKRALEKSPSYGLAIYNLGAVYDRQGRVTEAIIQLEKIVPYNANEPVLIFELGLLYIRAEQKTDAMAALQRVVLLAPQYANARWYLALLLEERGDVDGALAQLYEIRKSNPENETLEAKIAQLEAGRQAPSSAEVIDNKPLTQ
jgi:tetratricopeptide (TPR) repeat protein